jgi:hypothetical protein
MPGSGLAEHKAAVNNDAIRVGGKFGSSDHGAEPPGSMGNNRTTV